MHNAYIYPITNRFKSEVYNPYIDNFITYNSVNYVFLNKNEPSDIGIFNILKYIKHVDIIFFNWIEKIPEFKGGYLQSAFLTGLLAYCKIKGIKIVWTVHNKIGHSKKQQGMKRIIFKMMMKKSDFFITHSSEGKLLINSYAPASKHIFYFPHPVTENLMNKNEIKAYDILIWGSLVPYKGIDAFLEHLSKNNLQYKYSIKIIGKCNDALYLMKLKTFANQNISIENKFSNNGELHKLISTSKILLFTYTSDSVLSSGALAESVAQGAIVVGPNKAAFKDLSELGFIFSYTDFDSMIELIDDILSSRKTLQKEQFNRFIKDYHWSEFASKLHQELNK